MSSNVNESISSNHHDRQNTGTADAVWLEMLVQYQLEVMEMLGANIPRQEILHHICAWAYGLEEGLRISIAITAPAYEQPDNTTCQVALTGKQGNILGYLNITNHSGKQLSAGAEHFFQLLARMIVRVMEYPQGGQSEGTIPTYTSNKEDEIAAQRENFYQLLMDTPAVIAVLSGPQHVYILANKLYMQTIGSDRQIIGKPIREALPELADQGIYQLLDEVYRTGEPFIGYEIEVGLDKTGSGEREPVFFNFVYQPIKDAEDRVFQILVHAMDVTQSVLQRRSAEKSEQQFKSFVANSPTPIGIYVGKELRIQTVNDAILQAWEKDDSVVGKTFREALPELEGQPFFQILDRVYDTGETYEAVEEKVMLMRDGVLTPTYYNFTYKALRNEQGEIYAVMNTAMEVTEQVKAKQRLAEAEENLRNAMEVAKLGDWKIDLQTRTTMLSERIQQWFGTLPGETITVEQATACITDPGVVTSALERALQPGSDGIVDIEYGITNFRTGEQRIMHTSGKVFLDRSGQPYMIVGISQDITEQRKLQHDLEHKVNERTRALSIANSELKEANKNLEKVNNNLEQYAYVTSHDLQEPLRKIKIFSDILQNRADTTPDNFTRKYLDKIDASVNRMMALITDLLNFSRLDKTNNTFVPTDINAIIEDVAEDFELAIKEKKVNLHISPLQEIAAVPLQIRQLFFNLIGNAIKFSRQHVTPEIHITGRPVSTAEISTYPQLNASWSWYEITVSDNGIGFEQRHAEKIFTIFQRLHTREVYSGTGIGLALCEKVVSNHQGKIYARGIVNEGASFHILLPVHR
ncbi:PAS domain-containing sensor histidine kinase [Chitinophaga rhizophila]|uniref:histidine kinase n=1 Tax=Chitinophaga rhizophila TaxID=2866212 RepID=A0ABS7GKH0_9BACT|nr:PAS domain-containing protein [Chitinophaga rhizophila]MBW8688226.1 PAS domain-containing protein [Chitinophaga rhizophila]